MYQMETEHPRDSSPAGEESSAGDSFTLRGETKRPWESSPTGEESLAGDSFSLCGDKDRADLHCCSANAIHFRVVFRMTFQTIHWTISNFFKISLSASHISADSRLAFYNALAVHWHFS
ncbi:hypothetical protein GW17_00013326 [Ensete ventricosum]|nr:hypothetical protein GW17_00013326 [Ensete ventricosum]